MERLEDRIGEDVSPAFEDEYGFAFRLDTRDTWTPDPLVILGLLISAAFVLFMLAVANAGR